MSACWEGPTALQNCCPHFGLNLLDTSPCTLKFWVLLKETETSCSCRDAVENQISDVKQNKTM